MCLSIKSYQSFGMKIIPLLFLISVLLFSCESESVEQVNTLGSEISISLAEYLEPQQRTLTFKFLTEKDFPCINYQISHDIQREGQAIHITLSSIEKADVCLNAIGPATAFIDVGNLPEGDYDLTIQLGQAITNYGALSVTPEAYKLSIEEPQGLLVENPELLRIPKDVIWGTVKYLSGQQNKNLYEAFLGSLEGIGASEKRLTEGNYFYFDIDATGKIRANQSVPDRVEIPFLMEFNGDEDQVIRVLNQMSQTFGEEVVIRVYNSRGEEFKS